LGLGEAEGDAPVSACALDDGNEEWRAVRDSRLRRVDSPSTPGLKVRFPFGPHPALFAESEAKVRAHPARTNPAVLPAWHLTTGLYVAGARLASV